MQVGRILSVIVGLAALTGCPNGDEDIPPPPQTPDFKGILSAPLIVASEAPVALPSCPDENDLGERDTIEVFSIAGDAYGASEDVFDGTVHLAFASSLDPGILATLDAPFTLHRRAFSGADACVPEPRLILDRPLDDFVMLTVPLESGDHCAVDARELFVQIPDGEMTLDELCSPDERRISSEEWQAAIDALGN